MNSLMCLVRFPQLPGSKTMVRSIRLGCTYICSDVENEMPLFNRIVSVIVGNDRADLLTCKVSTMFFDGHLNAFSIQEESDFFTLICVDELMYYRPYDRQFKRH